MSLYKEASIILTPNAYKEGKLYSIKPGNGAGDMNVVRATTATRVNAEGLIEEVPYNLLQRSEEFDNVIWLKIALTVTSNATTAPDGTLTADKLVENTSNTSHYLNQSITNQNSLFTYSVYAKKGERDFIFITAFATIPNNFTYFPFAYFNLNNGTIGTVSNCNASIQDAGNGWYRCTIQCTSIFPQTSAAVSFYNYTAIANNNNSYLGDGTSGIFLWGAQLVQGTQPKEYLRTETRLNIPRLDYTNGSCPSILVEPQRTNLVLRSEEFDNASWSKVRLNTSGTPAWVNVAEAPDGSLTAEKIIANTESNTHVIQRTGIAISTATKYTFSIFAKAGEHEFIGILGNNPGQGKFFDLANGVVLGDFLSAPDSAIIEDYGNGWYRCSITTTSTSTSTIFQVYPSLNGTSAVFTGNNSDGLYIWGAQLELGSNATSYIPTVASAVTRNADVISKTGIADLIGQSEGTLFVDMNFINNYNTGRLLAIGDGSTNNRIFINITTNNTFQVFIRNTAGIQYSSLSSANRPTGRYKLALAYKQNDFAFYLNGVLINSSTSGQVPPNLNNLYLSTSEFGSTAVELNSINSALIIPTRLDNATLATLTTL